MDEVVALDGSRGYGLLTRACGPVRGRTVVLFNAGLIHRIGPFRLHVRLARELADAGFDVFRFDLPRIGDAPPGTHAGHVEAAQEALDALQEITGNREFVVGGICSAADLGWRLATQDRRVTGLFMLDGIAVRNRWFRLGQLGVLLRRTPLDWPGMIARFFRARGDDQPGLLDYRDWPDRDAFERELAGLIERGVRILALYTGGVSYYLLHRRQIDATFGRLRRHPSLQCDFLPELDHILFSPAERASIVSRLCRWSITL